MLKERALVLGAGRSDAVLESRPVPAIFADLHESRGAVLSRQLNYTMVRPPGHFGGTVELLLDYQIPGWWPRSAQHDFEFVVVPPYDCLALNDDKK